MPSGWAPKRDSIRTETVTVSVKYRSRNNMILVPVSIDGKKPADFVLDTGAGRCVIDARYFAEISNGKAPEKGGRAKVLGGGGTAHAGAARIRKLRVKSADGDSVASIDDFPVIVMDLSHLKKALKIPLAGILGANFLREFRVTIDYRRRIVDFEPFPAKKPKRARG